MKKIIVLICLGISSFQSLNAQESNQWTHIVFDDTITFNFGNEKFKIDTVDFVEGYFFYFKSMNDSSYFRLNIISPSVKFERFDNDRIYKIKNNSTKFGVVDRSGKIGDKCLYWRELKNENIRIVYNYCPKKKLKSYNKIMDSVSKKLRKNKL
jgi:hypothetical protein